MSLQKDIDGDKYYYIVIGSLTYIPGDMISFQVSIGIKKITNPLFVKRETIIDFNLRIKDPTDEEFELSDLQLQKRQINYEYFRIESLRTLGATIVTQCEKWLNENIEIFKDFSIVD